MIQIYLYNTLDHSTAIYKDYKEWKKKLTEIKLLFVFVFILIPPLLDLLDSSRSLTSTLHYRPTR